MNRRIRQTARLSGYDHAQRGIYCITIVTQNRTPLFGEIVQEEMVLNGAGQIVQSVWNHLPERFPSVLSDVFQIMPNHIRRIDFASTH